jgi:hypothetical protein
MVRNKSKLPHVATNRIYIYTCYSSIHHLDQPTINRPSQGHARSTDRTPRGMEPARPHEPKHSCVSRLPLRAQSRSIPHEPKRLRAPRPTRLSHFLFLLSHFSYRARSFYDFVNHSATVISAILATMISHFRELSHSLLL